MEQPMLLSTSGSTRSLLVNQSTRKSVTFGDIEVREYRRIVGDHPDVKVGPPISIGWDFYENEPKSLDEFEEARPQRRKNLRLSSITRKNLLHNVFQIPEEEIRQAEKEVQKIQRQRDHSNKQGKASEAVEGAFLSARRKFTRTFSRETLYNGFAAVSGSLIPLGMHP